MLVPHWSKAASFLLSHLDFSAYLSILSLASTLIIVKPSSTNMMESILEKKTHKYIKTASGLLRFLLSVIFSCQTSSVKSEQEHVHGKHAAALQHTTDGKPDMFTGKRGD